MNISKTAERLYERTRVLRIVITENQEEIDAIERLLSIWEKEADK